MNGPGQKDDAMTESPSPRPAAGRFIRWLALAIIVLLGAYFRFEGIGVRSLWLDELCTWHVSRLPLIESLNWAPELTIPPLYQFCLRLLTEASHPTEWLMRLPAAFCGILLIPTGYWLGRMVGGTHVGIGMALLLACNAMQIEYAREARPYSMLVLGSTWCTALWFRLLTQPKLLTTITYVAVATLTMHAHYLFAFTLITHLIVGLALGRSYVGTRRPLIAAIVMTAALCLPLAIRLLLVRDSAVTLIDWIEPATLKNRILILADVTIGNAWLIVLAGSALVLLRKRRNQHDANPIGAAPVFALLVTWFSVLWLGLFLVSWLIQPVFVARYALPLSIPALLIPLIAARRINRRGPLVLAGIFFVFSGPQWLPGLREINPGVRELATFLDRHVAAHDAVVAWLPDQPDDQSWTQMHRLSFDYYPLDHAVVREIKDRDRLTGDSPLREPGEIVLLFFRADPRLALANAGRERIDFHVEGQSFSQLSFGIYQLIRVAPLERREGEKSKS